jgi:hypothetical protein
MRDSTAACIAAALGAWGGCCAPRPASTAPTAPMAATAPTAPTAATAPTAPTAPTAANAASWREAYDLDGDGTNDRIISEFTGGAHCCYRVGAALSSTGISTVFPFEMDGGYPGGLDLSQPARFMVRTRNGALPEIVYEVATYNGEPQPLDPEITARWGIRSHRVALCFAGGKPRAADDTPDLPACKR